MRWCKKKGEKPRIRFFHIEIGIFFSMHPKYTCFVKMHNFIVNFLEENSMFIHCCALWMNHSIHSHFVFFFLFLSSIQANSWRRHCAKKIASQGIHFSFRKCSNTQEKKSRAPMIWNQCNILSDKRHSPGMLRSCALNY